MPDSAAAPVAGPGRARAQIERDLAILDAITEAGYRIVLDLQRQSALRMAVADRAAAAAAAAAETAIEPEAVQPEATQPEAETPALPSAGIHLDFTRVTRAVRLTILLKAKLNAALERLDTIDHFEARDAAREAGRVREARAFERKARVQLVIERVAQTEHPGDGETVDRIVDEGCERMRDDERFGALLSGPVSNAIDYICRALGLSPDWPRLAQTAWAQKEIVSGEVGAPLAALPRAKPRKAPPPTQAQAETQAGLETGAQAEPPPWPPGSEQPKTFTFVIPPLPPESRSSRGRRARPNSPNASGFT